VASALAGTGQRFTSAKVCRRIYIAITPANGVRRGVDLSAATSV
jgi:hypothetical protein